MTVLKQLEKAVSSAFAKIGIILIPNEKLREIVSLLPITYDDENEELEKKAFEIINEDGFEDYINNEVDNSGQTILDFVLKCDSQGEKRLNNSALIRLEQGIRILGGKTAEELEQKLGEKITSPVLMSIIATLILCTPKDIGAQVGQRLDIALGLPERTPIFADILATSLFAQTLTISMVFLIILDKNKGIQFKIRDAVKLSFRSGIMKITQILAISTSVLYESLILKYQNDDIEWKEALGYGLTVGAGVGIVCELSKALAMRFLSAPNTTIEQVGMNPQMEQVHQHAL